MAKLYDIEEAKEQFVLIGVSVSIMMIQRILRRVKGIGGNSRCFNCWNGYSKQGENPSGNLYRKR